MEPAFGSCVWRRVVRALWAVGSWLNHCDPCLMWSSDVEGQTDSLQVNMHEAISVRADRKEVNKAGIESDQEGLPTGCKGRPL